MFQLTTPTYLQPLPFPPTTAGSVRGSTWTAPDMTEAHQKASIGSPVRFRHTAKDVGHRPTDPGQVRGVAPPSSI